MYLLNCVSFRIHRDKHWNHIYSRLFLCVEKWDTAFAKTIPTQNEKKKKGEDNSLILSMEADNLISSSGHISGQWVNPKYKMVHFPNRSFSVTRFPSSLIRLNGPPMAAFPADGPSFTAIEFVFISKRRHQEHQVNIHTRIEKSNNIGSQCEMIN